MDKKFVKLSELVGSQFTVSEVGGYTFKKWDNDAKRMLTSEKYEDGFRKLYPVTTDKGQLDMGSGQIGSLLEATFKNGKADLVNKTFAVKSNGKSGIDIRYFFNLVRQEYDQTPSDEDAPIDLASIPF